MNALMLVTDAYGGRGGIALYNRNLIESLCSWHKIDHVTALPRSITYDLEPYPSSLTYINASSGSVFRYIFQCLKSAFVGDNFGLIICGHLHLLPFAYLLSLRFKCPLISVIYGVESWTPTPHGMVNYLCSKVSAFISIRHLTTSRLKEWADIDGAELYYLPCCVDTNKFKPLPKRDNLTEKFGLVGKKVILTCGRLDINDDFDKRKGFDEIIEILPKLRTKIPEIVYLIVGDGDDRARLQLKAKNLGVEDIVIFSGYVCPSEQADLYCLGDVFAMPGSNPLFDRYPYRLVFLEALACGLPVVGSVMKNELDAADPIANKLITQVDPFDQEDIIRGILKGLTTDKKFNPLLEVLSYESFTKNAHGILDQLKPNRP
jgi:phosphatidylinositol alpha-1,6-mannosyltransferase